MLPAIPTPFNSTDKGLVKKHAFYSKPDITPYFLEITYDFFVYFPKASHLTLTFQKKCFIISILMRSASFKNNKNFLAQGMASKT
jgi:hypothetical protein